METAIIKGSLMPASKVNLAELETCACCGCQTEVRKMQVSFSGEYLCQTCVDARDDVKKCFVCGEFIIINGETKEEYEWCGCFVGKVYFCADCCKPKDQSGYPQNMERYGGNLIKEVLKAAKHS